MKNKTSFYIWLVSKSEEIEALGDCFSVQGHCGHVSFFENDYIMKYFLFHSAMFGINKGSFLKNGRYEIISRRWGYVIEDYKKQKQKKFTFEEYPDNAIEKTLLYLFEKEVSK